MFLLCHLCLLLDIIFDKQWAYADFLLPCNLVVSMSAETRTGWSRQTDLSVQPDVWSSLQLCCLLVGWSGSSMICPLCWWAFSLSVRPSAARLSLMLALHQSERSPSLCAGGIKACLSERRIRRGVWSNTTCCALVYSCVCWVCLCASLSIQEVKGTICDPKRLAPTSNIKTWDVRLLLN